MIFLDLSPFFILFCDVFNALSTVFHKIATRKIVHISTFVDYLSTFLCVFWWKTHKNVVFLRLLHKMRKSYPQSSFFIGGQPVFVHIYSKTTAFFIHSKCINGFFPQKYPLFDKQKGEYLSTIKTQVWITLLVFFRIFKRFTRPLTHL